MKRPTIKAISTSISVPVRVIILLLISNMSGSGPPVFRFWEVALCQGKLHSPASVYSGLLHYCEIAYDARTSIYLATYFSSQSITRIMLLALARTAKNMAFHVARIAKTCQTLLHERNSLYFGVLGLLDLKLKTLPYSDKEFQEEERTGLIQCCQSDQFLKKLISEVLLGGEVACCEYIHLALHSQAFEFFTCTFGPGAGMLSVLTCRPQVSEASTIMGDMAWVFDLFY